MLFRKISEACGNREQTIGVKNSRIIAPPKIRSHRSFMKLAIVIIRSLMLSLYGFAVSP